MERTISLINSELKLAGIDVSTPCDDHGNRR
jgi:hypothetical protein